MAAGIIETRYKRVSKAKALCLGIACRVASRSKVLKDDQGIATTHVVLSLLAGSLVVSSPVYSAAGGARVMP